MKKILSLLLVTLLLVSMTACGGNKETNTEANPNTNTNPSTPSTEASTPNAEDSASVESKFDWEIKDVKRPDDKITLRTVKKAIRVNHLAWHLALRKCSINIC